MTLLGMPYHLADSVYSIPCCFASLENKVALVIDVNCQLVEEL